MIARIALHYLGNWSDAEDMVQEVILKWIESAPVFKDEEHEKSWFIRVTINACKDFLKSFFRSRVISLDDILDQPAEIREDHREVLEAVLSLPQKYRDVVYLHYYEGYTASEIGDILNKKVNTVYTLLMRSKQMLREKLEGDE